MNSVNLITRELRSISKYIEGIEIRYEFDKVNLIHLVEVKPLDLFENNTAYLDKEIEIEDKFFKLFPKENLVFISEDSLCKINNPDLELPLKIKYENEIKPSFHFDELFNLNIIEVEETNNYALAA
nr:hypothetical protein [uncultured bacterium]